MAILGRTGGAQFGALSESRRGSFLSPFHFLLLMMLVMTPNGLNIGHNTHSGGSRSRHPPKTYSNGSQASEQAILSVGIILPHTHLQKREYYKRILQGCSHFDERSLGKYKLNIKNVFQQLQINSPTKILATLCQDFLPKNVSAILYITNDESYGRNTASAQYFLQLAGYLGIPVIAWNADNSGLEQAYQSGFRIQMAPSIHHQGAAMLSILSRYKWHAFTLITSHIAGYTDFVQTIRDQVHEYGDPQDISKPTIKFTIIDTVLVNNAEEDLLAVSNSEARIMLLYSTKSEAQSIMRAAQGLGLAGKDYVWIVTQSVVGSEDAAPNDFPIGMLGVHFETNINALLDAIVKTIRVFGYGVINFVSDTRNERKSLYPKLSCEGQANARWSLGSSFHRSIRDISVPFEELHEGFAVKRGEKINVEFNQDGTRRDVELKIVNLRNAETGTFDSRKWTEIGTWRSWEGLTINDIVWPGHQHVPPPGVPEKFNLKIVFLEEPPYISLAPADPITGQCNANRGILCQVANESMIEGVNMTLAKQNSTFYQCCSGFCIDLLKKFSEDLGFTYDLVRVEDGKWGTIEYHESKRKQDSKWNGLVAALMNHKADMALSSFKINSERESVIDFTVPFLESGIAILVAKRTGIISPTAFLEPFDTASWMLVAFVAIQVAALTIFLFEWLSPGGYNMKVAPPRDHKFSLLRTYWLVWAVLFQAAVHVDCPRGFTARFMANIWAMFAVVFLAIYTANLAAFMITREEYHDFSGVEDHRLQNPYVRKPAFKFGTVPFTNAESVLAKHHTDMYRYMKEYNKSTVAEGISTVKKGEMDAFIYDATVLDYLVGQDEECRLLTVGNWYATTGYGLAFPRNSKYTAAFNKILMEYKDNGDIERLQRFWLTGACKPKKHNKRASEPLALEQFLSAYLLLFSGILLAAVLLILEHIYFKYLRKHLAKTDSGGCCALISLSMGKSLTFRGAVFEAQDKLRRHRCRDPICDTHIWKVKHELDMARVKIKQLEKELESHGVKPSKKFAPSLKTKRGAERDMVGDRKLYGGVHDMTRNHVTSNDPSRPSTASSGARHRTSMEIREIAEMETVL